MTLSGNIDRILEAVPFTNCEDEPRLISIVKKWIEDEEVPEFKIFTEEPEAKRKRRHRKYEKEKQVVADSKISDQDLYVALQEKQEDRHQKMDEMIKKLEEKYKSKKKGAGRKSLRSNNSDVDGAATSSAATKVKNGRVTKKKK